MDDLLAEIQKFWNPSVTSSTEMSGGDGHGKLFAFTHHEVFHLGNKKHFDSSSTCCNPADIN